MKIKAAIIAGLLILNGSAYAMTFNSAQVSLPFFKAQEKAQIELPKIHVPDPGIQIMPEKSKQIESRLNRLILDYQISRVLNTSS